MSKEQLMALAGPLTIVVGALILVGPISDLVQLFRPPYSETLWEFFHFQAAALAVAVMLPAFIGIWLRYKEAAGGLGRLGLILNVAGCGTVLLTLAANFLLDVLQLLKHPTGPNYLMAGGIVSILIGHVLFGIDALRYKLLLWSVPMLFVESDSPLYFTLERTIASLQSATIGMCWVLIGITMMSQREGHEATAAA